MVITFAKDVTITGGSSYRTMYNLVITLAQDVTITGGSSFTG